MNRSIIILLLLLVMRTSPSVTEDKIRNVHQCSVSTLTAGSNSEMIGIMTSAGLRLRGPVAYFQREFPYHLFERRGGGRATHNWPLSRTREHDYAIVRDPHASTLSKFKKIEK